MHTGIRAAGADKAHTLGRDAAESSLGNLLHTARGLLCLPARVGCAVVFNSDGESHPLAGKNHAFCRRLKTSDTVDSAESAVGDFRPINHPGKDSIRRWAS